MKQEKNKKKGRSLYFTSFRLFIFLSSVQEAGGPRKKPAMSSFDLSLEPRREQQTINVHIGVSHQNPTSCF